MHAAELVVGVRDVAGEHLGHAGEETLLVVVERVPRPDRVEHGPGLAVGTGGRGLAVRVDRGELGVREAAVPAPSGGPGSRGGWPRSPGRTGPCTCRPTPSGTWCGAWPACGARYMKNGLSGSMTLPSRMNSMAWSERSLDEVVAVLGRGRRVDLVVVVDQVRVPAARLAAEEAVEALEAATQRPPPLVGRQVASPRPVSGATCRRSTCSSRARRAPRR